MPADPVDDARQLEADEHEEHGVEDEDEDLPHREGLDPGGRRDELRRVPAEVDAGGHRGQDRRDAERLGRQVGEVRRDERDRDLRRGVVERLAQRRDDVADGDADRDADDRVEDEAPARLGHREAPADRGRHRELVGDEGRRVVDQRLAFDDRHVAARGADARGDRRRRDGIGRRHDGAQHERRLPRHAVDDLVGDDGHAEHREDHEADREQADLAQVVAQLAQRGEEGRGVEQRRQDDDQHDVGVELHVGDAGDEAQRRAADHEQDRIRDLPVVGDDEQDRDGAQHREEHEVQVGLRDHAVTRCAGSPPPAPRRPRRGPTKPMPSPVEALTLTCSGTTPRPSASAARIASR